MEVSDYSRAFAEVYRIKSQEYVSPHFWRLLLVRLEEDAQTYFEPISTLQAIASMADFLAIHGDMSDCRRVVGCVHRALLATSNDRSEDNEPAHVEVDGLSTAVAHALTGMDLPDLAEYDLYGASGLVLDLLRHGHQYGLHIGDGDLQDFASRLDVARIVFEGGAEVLLDLLEVSDQWFAEGNLAGWTNHILDTVLTAPTQALVALPLAFVERAVALVAEHDLISAARFAISWLEAERPAGRRAEFADEWAAATVRLAGVFRRTNVQSENALAVLQQLAQGDPD